MKMFSFFKKHWKAIVFKPLFLIVIIVLTCMGLNFILVPPHTSNTIGTFMTDFKSQKEDVDILFLGSSRSFRGIDTASLSEDLNMNIFNLSQETPSYASIYHVFLEAYKYSKPKEVFLEVSTRNFIRSYGSRDSYIYRFLTGENRENFKSFFNIKYNDFSLFEFSNFLEYFSSGDFKQNIQFKIAAMQGNISKSVNSKGKYKGKGYLEAYSIAKQENLVLPKSYFIDGKLWEDSFVNKNQIQYFYDIIEFCQNNEIKVTLYSPLYYKDILMSNKEDFMKFDLFIDNILNQYNIEYLDFSKIRKNFLTITADMFFDANHCNFNGAAALEPIIAEILVQKMNNTYNHSAWFYNNYLEFAAAYIE